jgi:hypothetical protein
VIELTIESLEGMEDAPMFRGFHRIALAHGAEVVKIGVRDAPAPPPLEDDCDDEPGDIRRVRVLKG